MQYFSDVVQDRNGNVVSSASVLVKNYPALTTATIYDSTGASIANPITTSSDGEYTFYCVPGAYTIVTSKSGITTKTRSNVIIGTPGATINIKEPPYSAVGDGTTDDTAAIQAAATAAVGKGLYFPSGTYLITSAISPGANTRVYGDGWTTVLKTTTISTHLFSVTAAGVHIRDMKLLGANGSTEINNSGVYFGSGSDHGSIERCELTGMAGSAILCSATSYITIKNNYIHGLAGSLGNSADISLYDTVSNCIVDGNICLGGTTYQTGILLQLTSTDHKVTNNYIGAHVRYGIIDYDVTPRNTNNLIQGNTVKDIDGSALSGTSGAGIYLEAVGGTKVIGNYVTNTNISTTTETLAPAGIGINNAYGEILISNNVVFACNWHGIDVVSAASTGRVTVTNNTVENCIKTSILVRNSAYTKVTGNTVTQNSSATDRGIYFNETATTLRKGQICSGNQVYAYKTRPIHMEYADTFVCSGNNIVIVAAGPTLEGYVFDNSKQGAISGNVIDSLVNTGYAMIISATTATRVSGNTLINTTGAGRTLLQVTGTCTGTFVDSSNYLSSPIDVGNGSTGGRVEITHTGAPAVRTWAVGDRCINIAPSVGAAKAWTCTTAGTPGTWTSEGNL